MGGLSCPIFGAVEMGAIVVADIGEIGCDKYNLSSSVMRRQGRDQPGAPVLILIELLVHG